MPGRIYEIRYPNGDFEIDAGTQRPPPVVGDTIWRRGEVWKVTSTDDTEKPVVVRVEPDGEAKRSRRPSG
jgi:hypothetical protein